MCFRLSKAFDVDAGARRITPQQDEDGVQQRFAGLSAQFATYGVDLRVMKLCLHA